MLDVVISELVFMLDVTIVNNISARRKQHKRNVMSREMYMLDVVMCKETY